MHVYLCDILSNDTAFTVEVGKVTFKMSLIVLTMQATKLSKNFLIVLSSSFYILDKNCCNLQMHSLL